MTYTSHLLTDQNYTDLQYLLKQAFGLNRSLDFIRTKYDTEGFGKKNVGIIAKDEEANPAAYYGVFPLRLNYKGNDLLIAQSGDTMTAPDHRKKGLFTRLAKETYDLCRSNGIELVFGFPNENSLPGFQRKLDWKFTGFMQRFTLTGAVIPFCELATRFPTLAGVYAAYFRNRIKSYTIGTNHIDSTLFEDPNAKGYLPKDRDFLNYKLRRSNVALIELDGFVMLIKASTHLIIGAVNYFEENQTQKFLKMVSKLSKKLLCKKTHITVSTNHWLYDRLRSIDQPTQSLPIGFYQINPEIDYKSIAFTQADYDTF